MIDDNVYDEPGKNDHFVEVRHPPLLVNNNTYTASVYLKPAGDPWGMVNIYGSEYKTWKNSFFDITNGTVGYKTTPGIDSTRITSAGNGWYRCEVTFNSGYGNITPVMQIFTSKGDYYDNPSIDFTGDNVNGIYIWGAQTRKGNDCYTLY